MTRYIVEKGSSAAFAWPVWMASRMYQKWTVIYHRSIFQGSGRRGEWHDSRQENQMTGFRMMCPLDEVSRLLSNVIALYENFPEALIHVSWKEQNCCSLCTHGTLQCPRNLQEPNKLASVVPSFAGCFLTQTATTLYRKNWQDNWMGNWNRKDTMSCCWSGEYRT